MLVAVSSEHERRLEQSKKTINVNMKTINNLVNEYTQQTHEVIFNQLNQASASVGTIPPSPMLASEQYSLKSVLSVIDDLQSVAHLPRE